MAIGSVLKHLRFKAIDGLGKLHTENFQMLEPYEIESNEVLGPEVLEPEQVEHGNSHTRVTNSRTSILAQTDSPTIRRSRKPRAGKFRAGLAKADPRRLTYFMTGFIFLKIRVMC